MQTDGPSVDPTLALDADRDMLLAAVGNLLQNGFKFMQNRTSVALNVRGRRCRTTIPDDSAARPLDHVNRQFQASRPNQLWVADFTYVATLDRLRLRGLCHRCVFARRIIGWRVARSMHAELVLDALEQAIWSRSGIEGVVHHSDRGSQPSAPAPDGWDD